MVESPHFGKKRLRSPSGGTMIKMSEGGEHMLVVEEYRTFLKKKSDFTEEKINRICYTTESLLNDLTTHTYSSIGLQ